MDTIVDAFERHVSELADRPALKRRVGDDWETLTWADYGREVERVAGGLAGLGVGPGDFVGILSANRVEWHLADVAILRLGAVTVPLYATSAPPQVAYFLDHSGARVCFVENHDQLAKVLEVWEKLPRLERVILFEGEDSQATTLSELKGETPGPRAALTPFDLATLVYTSGTTGPPKATMITHGNIAWTADSLRKVVPFGPGDRVLSFLPLSHIAERMVSDFLQIHGGAETWFARKLETVPEDLRACRPTVFFAVPRLWQKFQQAILQEGKKKGGVAGALLRRYLSQVERAASGGGARPSRLLDRLVGAKVRSQLGLDQARFLVSGAAAIDPGLLRWFDALGLPVAEVYGQSEGCGPTTLNPPGRIRIGTVGPPIPGVEVRVDEDDEVLVKGGNVTPGYLHDEAATKELLDPEGWMHTGDLGTIEPDGYLRITGRKKDLIINAAGKNISPSEIETRLQAEPLVANAVVIGEGRRYLVALLTADADADSRDAEADMAAAVDRVNRELSPVEQIKKWKLLERDFTIGEELTPTLKVKRAVVAERYAADIEALYAD